MLRQGLKGGLRAKLMFVWENTLTLKRLIDDLEVNI